MENIIKEYTDTFHASDEPKLRGTYVFIDEDGRIIFSGHNMIVLTGRQYIINRCFTSETKATFKFFLARKTNNDPITPETTVPASGNLVDLTKFVNASDIETVSIGSGANDTADVINSTELTATGNACYLKITRTLELLNDEHLDFNSFGLTIGTGANKILFSQAAFNTIKMNSKRKVTLIYTLRF